MQADCLLNGRWLAEIVCLGPNDYAFFGFGISVYGLPTDLAARQLGNAMLRNYADGHRYLEGIARGIVGAMLGRFPVKLLSRAA